LNLDIIKVLLPTDAQENCFKRSIKIYIYNVKNSQLKYMDVVNLVVWLHMLSGPCWCMSAVQCGRHTPASDLSHDRISCFSL